MSTEFFPEKKDFDPKIYAYSDNNPQYKGYLKIGYTTVDVIKRVSQQYPTVRPGRLPYKILLEESAMRSDGTSFQDHDVFKILRKKNIINPRGEWFKCKISEVKAAINACRERDLELSERSLNFKMRPEQIEAVRKTSSYFRKIKNEDKKSTPHFLWNAKMRFGKTFTAYQLAKEMNWKKVLILTFKPAAQNAWEEDLTLHIDFKKWQFISRDGKQYEEINKNKPFVCFASFQNFLGKNKAGGIKIKNEWAHTINWDCIIFDEYHYGAWRENAKELFESEEKNEFNIALKSGLSFFQEDGIPLTTDFFLYLTGTPFRAISTGEFIEEQIYNWTYSDEQKAKLTWKKKNNPYSSLPRMIMLTYQIPDSIKDLTSQGEFDEFDLNEFFHAFGEKEKAKFKYENEVQKWLELIRGNFRESENTFLKLGKKNRHFHIPTLN